MPGVLDFLATALPRSIFANMKNYAALQRGMTDAQEGVWGSPASQVQVTPQVGTLPGEQGPVMGARNRGIREPMYAGSLPQGGLLDAVPQQQRPFIEGLAKAMGPDVAAKAAYESNVTKPMTAYETANLARQGEEFDANRIDRADQNLATTQTESTRLRDARTKTAHDIYTDTPEYKGAVAAAEAPYKGSPEAPIQIFDPNSPSGARYVPRNEAIGQPGPMTANSPAPAISATSREANAARVAAGEPQTSVFPGYRGNVMAQREQARGDAIEKIMTENPGMSASDAGTELANRTIAFQSGKKSAGQLTQMLGATRQAVGQLDFNIKKTKEEMAKLGSSDLSPFINAIARGEERWTGNPAYSSLFYYMHATAVESARLLSGGQSSAAQLHQGAMEEANKWANINMTPASFDAVADAMTAEGANRVQTYTDALKAQRVGGPPAGGAAATTQQQGADDPVARARDAISKGANRAAVIKRLRDAGVDPGNL